MESQNGRLPNRLMEVGRRWDDLVTQVENSHRSYTEHTLCDAVPTLAARMTSEQLG